VVLAAVIDGQRREVGEDLVGRHMPCATVPTTVATGIRAPRTHRTPPMIRRSMKIRSKGTRQVGPDLGPGCRRRSDRPAAEDTGCCHHCRRCRP
jgi:hypothetical protein